MKKLLLGFLMVYVLHANAQTPFDRDLIAHYPLTVDAKDTTRYKMDGKALSGAATDTYARCGFPAFYFDGIDDYVDCGNNKVFERGLRELTISAWVQPTQDHHESGFLGLIVGKWAFDKTKDQFAIFINDHNRLVMSIGDGKEYGKGIYGAKSLKDRTWYHIVGKWQHPNTITLYINGKKDRTGQQEGTTGMNPKSEVSMKIGRQVITHNRPFKGHISSVRLYKRALSDTEVEELYKYENSICQKFFLEGDVLNEKTMQPIESSAQIVVKDLNTGDSVLTTQSDPIDGYYKIELPIGLQYGVFAKAENYRYISINQNVDTRANFKNKAGVTDEIVVRRDLLMIPFEVGEKVRANNIFFETAKSDLQPASYSELDFLVTLFKEFPKLKLEIGGHTDNVGDDGYNQRLSQDRANSVMNYLISKGAAASQIIAKGYGETVPIATNDTEEGKQQNRRVEFTILEK